MPTKQELVDQLQAALIEAEAASGCLISMIYKEGAEDTLTCLQDADLALRTAHRHYIKAEKCDGTASTKGGGGGR